MNVRVANDTNGLITFTITTKNAIPDNHSIALVIDSDKSRGTGEVTPFAGWDYILYAFRDNPAAFAWNGSDYNQVSPPSFRATVAGSTAEIAINRADLGNTAGFTFYAASLSFDAGYSVTHVWDEAPASGLATYTLTQPAQLTIAKAGAGSGTVVAAGSTLDCGTNCSTTIDTGQTLTLQATPDPGSTFAAWSGGGCSGAQATCSVTLSADTTVTATFSKARFPLVIRKVGRGTVTSKPVGIACGSRCRSSFLAGPVVLTARPAAGYRFLRWSGSCRGTRPACRIVLARAANVTATFAKT